MKKLMLATMASLSFLLPNKLDSSSDTIKKGPEVKVLVNVLTGETIRVRELDPSYWSWIDPKLSERLDSLAGEAEKTKNSADTFYITELRRELPSQGVEILRSPLIDSILVELGYKGSGNWGDVGKKLITAWKQSDDYSTKQIITFSDAIGGSSICFPYAVVMYTLMKNKGLDPLYFGILPGYFKESGEVDSIILVGGMRYGWHAAVYLDGKVYDNNAAYPAGEGEEEGYVPAQEYLKYFRIPPRPFEQDWASAIFLLGFRKSPWDIVIAEISDTSHIFYGWDATLVSGLEQKDMGSYRIVYSPELKEMIKEMSSSQK